jgi:hypothetical protein
MKRIIIISSIIVFLFISNIINAQWVQIGSDIDGEAEGDNSGYSVSLSSDGSIVAIGARWNYGYNGDSMTTGHVRVYEYNGINWVQLGNDIDGEAVVDLSGWSISLSSDGSIVAVGAIGNDGNGTNAGHVRVYEYNGINWIQMGNDIDGEAMMDLSGWSISLSSDGSIVAIGADHNDGNGTSAGHVRVYEYNGINWIQLGNDIDGKANSDNSGYSISLSSDGSVIAIGAPFNDGDTIYSDCGHVRVYEYSGVNWVQLGNNIDGEATDDQSGYSVSLSSDGSIVAIGAKENDGNGSASGHARVFEYTGGNWVQLGTDIDGVSADDNFGFSVSLSSDGSIVAIGAGGNDGNGTDAGHIRIFEYNGSNWGQLHNDIDGEDAGDYSGNSISLSSDGSIVAIGATGNNGNDTTDTNRGHVRIYGNITSINEVETAKSISIYPNPSEGKFSVLGNDFISIEIFNSKGQKVNTINTKNNKTTVNLCQEPKGIYFVKVISKNGVFVEKLVFE